MLSETSWWCFCLPDLLAPFLGTIAQDQLEDVPYQGVYEEQLANPILPRPDE
jgi:hypothetical protein